LIKVIKILISGRKDAVKYAVKDAASVPQNPEWKK